MNYIYNGTLARLVGFDFYNSLEVKQRWKVTNRCAEDIYVQNF